MCIVEYRQRNVHRVASHFLADDCWKNLTEMLENYVNCFPHCVILDTHQLENN